MVDFYMADFYMELAYAALKIVVALIGLFFSVVLAPWVKNHGIPWLKEKHLYGLCTKFVKAAEKLAESGAIDKDMKKEYVLSLLRNKGIKITDEIEAFIESAVEDLDLAFSSGILTAVDGFVIEDDSDEDAEDECGDFADDGYDCEYTGEPDAPIVDEIV